MQIVPRESASFGLPGDLEDIVCITANHSNMCRFDTANQADLDNYKLVRANMRRLYDNAVEFDALRVRSASVIVSAAFSEAGDSPTGV